MQLDSSYVGTLFYSFNSPASKMEVPLPVLTVLWTLIILPALCSTSGTFNTPDAAITLDPRTTSTESDLSTQATPPPHELRQRQERYTGITSYPGSVSVINSVGSVCGFVTSDIREHPFLDCLVTLSYTLNRTTSPTLTCNLILALIYCLPVG